MTNVLMTLEYMDQRLDMKGVGILRGIGEGTNQWCWTDCSAVRRLYIKAKKQEQVHTRYSH